jgi:large subunit ribosomal protein L25
MDKVILSASERKEFSKAALSEIRRNKRVPGVVYSKHQTPVHFTVAQNDINPLVFTSKTHLVALQVEGKEELECIIKDVQFDPVTDKIIHLDFQALTKGEKIEMEVPIVLEGSAQGVKDGGLLQHLMHKVAIECEPANIPQHFVVNISKLKVGESVHAGSLKQEGIDILTPEDAVIVTIVHPRAEAEAAPGEGAEEPEVINKGKEKEE